MFLLITIQRSTPCAASTLPPPGYTSSSMHATDRAQLNGLTYLNYSDIPRIVPNDVSSRVILASEVPLLVLVLGAARGAPGTPDPLGGLPD